jgi:predicted transcriptional regulator
MDIGKEIALIRERKKISQRELAKRCKTSQTYICKLEKGDVNPTKNIERVLNELGCEIKIVEKVAD